MKNERILGAVVGDIVGSMYEWNNVKTTEFDLFPKGSKFTDDTIMTLAVALWLIEDNTHSKETLVDCMVRLGRRYPSAGYGGNFYKWIFSDEHRPYNSWGNGSAMRVSPVGLYADTLDEALFLAELSASVTHNHPEGIKGAQAVAACVFLCRKGKSKEFVKEYVTEHFGYNLDRSIDEIRLDYSYDVSCQGSVPVAIRAFLEGESFVKVLRLAVSVGGDSDTIACIAGSIAACFYRIPLAMEGKCNDILSEELQDIMSDFLRKIWLRNSFFGRVLGML
ncbi:MAG: ADP-ribosylglycohydrolase family protein [Prevotella sp.]